MTDRKHWDSIFASTEDGKLGWHETDTTQTMKFVEPLLRGQTPVIFLPGAGTSLLVDRLLQHEGRLILNDISGTALKKLEQRIGRSDRLTWLQQDIAKPLPDDLPPVDLWIDRAVLHFLLREEAIDAYFRNLKSVLRPGGHVLLAEFSTRGARKCAGLELHRYSLEEYDRRLGADFERIASEEHNYINPFGEPRPYVYGLYRRQPAAD